MAYDEDLAERIRELTDADPDLSERKMFGGLAFLVSGNMAVAATSGGLMVRVDPDEAAELSARPHARPFEMRGRPLRGWLLVEADGVRTRAELQPWVELGVAYAHTLPAKS